MRKIKIMLIAVAAVVSIGGAFATRPKCAACEYSTQYYFDGSGYFNAGVYGQDYICWTLPGSTCTYYQPNPVTQPNYYAPCRTGLFESFSAKGQKR